MLFCVFCVSFLVSSSMCEEIALLRRKLQRIDCKKIIFLDETNKHVGDISTHTIVLPGNSKLIETTTTSGYAPRYDMIAACTSERVFPPIIYAPNERERGINREMLLEYIRNILAQACGSIDRYGLLLVLDKATIHTEAKILQEFHDWGCQDLVQVIKMPTQAAKRMSPLDNSLFNIWTQRVYDCGPLTKRNIKQIMSDEWNKITTAELKKQYRHCGLMRGQNEYFDCPNPANHRHNT
jgi:hypothetical protein